MFSCNFARLLKRNYWQFVDHFVKLMAIFFVSEGFWGIFSVFWGVEFFSKLKPWLFEQIVFFQVCKKPVLFLQYLSAQEPQAGPNLARVIESVTLMITGQCVAGLGLNVTLPAVSQPKMFRKYVL